jgi:hypothetical protein
VGVGVGVGFAQPVPTVNGTAPVDPAVDFADAETTTAVATAAASKVATSPSRRFDLMTPPHHCCRGDRKQPPTRRVFGPEGGFALRSGSMRAVPS